MSKARVLVLGGGMREQIEKAGGEHAFLDYTDPRISEAVSHENIHGLILTGGQDIAPRIYGQKPHGRTQPPNHKRDLAELRALQIAHERQIPVLGICRGNQIINAAFGGTLHQHLGSGRAKHSHNYHLGHDHRVKLAKGSQLRKTLGDTEPWVVSIHHQAVAKVAPGFRVSAKSLDGIIEGIESKDDRGLISGVQFHPEISTNQTTQKVFNRLVARAAESAGLPKPVRPKPEPRKELWPQISTAVVEPRLITWQCFRCGIMFDERVDHVDHMLFLHGIDLQEVTTA